MQEYKYTYQDWLDGKIKPEDLRGLLLKEELDEDCYEIIREEQDEAYLKLLSDAFELKKRHFLDGYAACLVKQDYLNIMQIRNIEAYKERALEQEEIVSNAINGIVEAKKLTAYEIELCLSYDNNEIKEFYEYDEFITDLLLLREGFGVFRYILNSNFLEWLYWFREQQKLKVVEPAINQSAVLKDQKSYTWAQLFRDSEQAEKVLVLLSEFLTDTGQWGTDKAGRHLQGLYLELRKKGYMKSALTSPEIAIALNIQFGTNLTSKNFQESQLSKAEDYRDNFRHIPPYQPTPKG